MFHISSKGQWKYFYEEFLKTSLSERERQFPMVQISTKAKVEYRSQKLNPDLPSGWQEPRPWSHHRCPRIHLSRRLVFRGGAWKLNPGFPHSRLGVPTAGSKPTPTLSFSHCNSQIWGNMEDKLKWLTTWSLHPAYLFWNIILRPIKTCD